MAANNQTSINTGLSQLPDNPDDISKVYPELVKIYNAIKILSQNIDTYTGALQQPASAWPNIGLNTILSQNIDKLYVIYDETVIAGAMIHLYNVSGVLHARLAKAADATKPARGFSSNAVTSGDYGEVILFGLNSFFAGLTIGATYYLSPTSTTGQVTTTKPTTAGQVVQAVGFALSGASLFFNPPVAVIQL